MGAATQIRAALAQLIPSLDSNGSIESKIIDVVGTYADTEALERENTLNVINQALASQKITTIEYYRRKAVEFQYGDTLSYDPINQGGYYENVDATKQIIKQAYIVDNYPSFTILVNKIGSDGHLSTLTTAELASFNTYFQAFQPLGLRINPASIPVAQITDPGIVIYVKAGSDASQVAASINAAFKNAESVLRTTNVVSLTEITDLIQQTPEVTAVALNKPIATETTITGVSQVLSPIQGLFRLTAGAYTFATTITPEMIKVLQ